jgi:hypothetical protein
MDRGKSTLPLVKLPPEAEIVLYLIKEELKSHKFFSGLRGVGLDDCFYQPNLSTLIIGYTKLADELDDPFEFYYKLLEKYSEEMEADNESVTKQALNVYMDLISEKKRRCEQKKDTH